MAAANTSVAREYHAGLAAMLGIQAGLAAQRGHKAEESILEARCGFFEVYGGTNGDTGGAGIPLAGSAGMRALPGVVGNDRSLKPGIRFPRGREHTPDRESQVRRRLVAGGSRIRTAGPTVARGSIFDAAHTALRTLSYAKR
jgi:hypothetical protein